MAETTTRTHIEMGGRTYLAAGIEAAKQAYKLYSEVTMTAKYMKTVRQRGGGAYPIYAVSGTPEQLAAFKTVQSQVIVPGSDGSERTAFMEDPVTGQYLFVVPTFEYGRSINLAWTTGDPNVNPLGRFVIDDAADLFAQAQKVKEARSNTRGQILAERSLGLVGGLKEPRGNSNQSRRGNSELSPEEIEAMMNQMNDDAKTE